MSAISNQAGHVIRQRAGSRTASAAVARRPSTRTITEDGRIVPWLASEGPLSYTPESPPSCDYYFQYGWVLPGIFSPGSHRRRHFYFGAPSRDDARALFAFWNDAREGRTGRVACHFGTFGLNHVTAPLVVYSVHDWRGHDAYLLIQHGSYQIVPAADQPFMRDAWLVLYRGLAESPVFRFPHFDHLRLSLQQRDVWCRYEAVQADILSDSVVSFTSIHDRAKRCETSHILDGTWMSDALAEANGLEVDGSGFAVNVWRAAHQGFSLVRWVAAAKFGPHFVMCRTPLDNVRITTFFAGEHEARIVDPGPVEFLGADGCAVECYDPA